MTSNALPARQDTQGRQAVPSYPHIIRALNMVREEAEITQIELELKSDPVISYRLMMHVNAAGMGFPRQIRSYRQAISILGYHQLYRWLVRLLVQAGLAPSNAEARRLIEQGGVRLDDRVVRDPSFEWLASSGTVLQVGKRRFLRIVVG